MMARELFLVCLCAIVALRFGSAVAKKGIEQKIWESFGRTKDQSSYRPGEALNVSIRVQLITLSSYDEETAMLTVGYYLDQIWKDPTISWDRKKFNVSHLTLPTDKLWIPDIVPYRAESHEQVFDNRVIVYNDGKAMNIPYYKTRVTCEQVPEKRVEERICRMKLGSWTLDGFRLNLTMKDKVALDDASFTGLEASGWSFVNASTIYRVKYYPCCPEPYQDVTLIATIRRRPFPREKEEDDEENGRRTTRKPKKKYQNRRKLGEEEEEEEEEEGRRYSQRRPPRRRRRYPKRRMEEEEWEEGRWC